MKTTVILHAAFAATLISACSEGLLADMERSASDPTVAAPAASSFITENLIDVSWPEDPAADSCVLERAPDAAFPLFAEVYRGGGSHYTDSRCRDQERYLYRLLKVRGTRNFGPSNAVMGVSSAVCRDALEPNDDESLATSLASTLAANLFYYSSILLQDGAPLVQQDIDWYSVAVPPHRQANIVVTQNGLIGGSTNTWMYFYLKGANPLQIVNNQPIPVTNYSDETTAFLFKIYPIPSSFAVNGGGSLITYTVSLNSITSLQP